MRRAICLLWEVLADYTDGVEWGLKCKEGCTVWASL